MESAINGICSPQWFFWKDIFIDGIILLIVLFMLYAIFEYRKISKKDCYKSMLSAFLFISMSFILKILVNSIMYKDAFFPGWDFWTMKFHMGLLVMAYILSRVLFSLGVLYLYSLYYKPSKESLFLLGIIIFIALYFTRTTFYVWHIILVLFLALIVSKSLIRFNESKSLLRFITVSSFVLFLFSQLFFMFLEINPVFYVVGEFLQLFAYIAMASILVVVKYHGKKEKSFRHCC